MKYKGLGTKKTGGVLTVLLLLFTVLLCVGSFITIQTVYSLNAGLSIEDFRRQV